MKEVFFTVLIFFSLSCKILFAKTTYVKTFTGLNKYCDPLSWVYPSGTPLFDESTGKKISLEDYLLKKRLNIYCDSIHTKYLGGTPLFDEGTGTSITLNTYLKNKTVKIIKGLNEFCDSYDTVYKSRPSKDRYLSQRSLNKYCDPIGTYYPGGSPIFDEKNGAYKDLAEYLKNKTIRIYNYF